MNNSYILYLSGVGCETNLTYILVPNISIGGSIVKTIYLTIQMRIFLVLKKLLYNIDEL